MKCSEINKDRESLMHEETTWKGDYLVAYIRDDLYVMYNF